MKLENEEDSNWVRKQLKKASLLSSAGWIPCLSSIPDITQVASAQGIPSHPRAQGLETAKEA
jgi:hypothetical protein